MTYNVNFGLQPGKKMYPFIEKYQPDIILLQEINTEWPRFLKKNYEKLYPFRYWNYGRVDYPASGLAIASKHRIEKITYYDNPAGLFPAAKYIVRYKSRKIQILHVHLIPPSLDRKKKIKIKAA